MSAVPKLRFPEFSQPHAKLKFDEIFSFSTGKNIKQAESSPHFSIPCVRYGELYHMYDQVITKTINFTNLDRSELKFSEGDEILLPSAGEDPFDIGSASALKVKGVAIGRTINILRPLGNGVYEPAYMSYLINQVLRLQIAALAKGVSISNVYNSDLRSLFASIPSLPEQQKVASFLSSVEKKIDLLRQKKDALELYKTGFMQKIFSQKIRFKRDDGSDFPDWEETRVEKFCTFSKGKGVSKADLSEDGTLPCIRYGELYTHYSVKIDKVVSRTNTPAEKLILSDGGEVIIPASGEKPEDIATASVVMDKGVALGGDLNIIKTSADGYFLASYFSSEGRCRLASLAQGNSVVHLYSKQIASLDISLPSLPEQHKVTSYLSTIDLKIQNSTSQIEQMETFKKGLLQQMFV